MGPIAVRLHLVHLVPVAGRLNSPGVGTENVEGIVIFLVRDSGQCIDRCDVRRVDDRLALDSVGSVQRDLTEQTVEVAADEMILDVGPQAVEALADVLKTCRTLVWNGPLGAFEIEPCDAATVALARSAAALSKEGVLVSVAGGGDTVAALNHAGVAHDFTYISTAGGAFLEWLEGKPLPGVKALETK